MIVHYLHYLKSSDSGPIAPIASDCCTRPGISHLQATPNHTRTSRDSPYMHKDPISGSLLAQALGSCITSSPSKGDDVTKCSGAESSNTNFSFPEHFEGKRQSGEKDCLPLLSTFCKFQRLKVKGSQVMLVCLHEHTVAHKWSDVTDVNVCKLFMFRDSTLLWQSLHAFVCDCSSAPMVWSGIVSTYLIARSDCPIAPIVVR